MRYNEIINESNDVEPGHNWPVIVKSVRQWLANNVQVQPHDKSHFLDLLMHTDDLHARDGFDDLSYAFDSHDSAKEVLEQIYQAVAHIIDQSGDMIRDQFEDVHIPDGDIGTDRMDEILKAGAGDLIAYLKKHAAEEDAAAKASMKKIKTPSDRLANKTNIMAAIQTIKANVNKVAEAAWVFFEQDKPGKPINVGDVIRRHGKNHKVKDTDIAYMLDRKAKIGFTYPEQNAINNPEELLAAMRAKLDDASLVRIVVGELMSFLDDWKNEPPPGVKMFNSNWTRPTVTKPIYDAVAQDILSQF